jgi:hypothetical protein
MAGTDAATEAAILGTAAKLAEEARAHAKQNDAQAAFAPQLWRAVKETGLGGLCIPESLGGAEVSVALFCRVVELLAAADCTTSTLVHLQGNNAYLLRHAPKRRYALCTGIPFVLVLLTVDYAGALCVRTWWLDALKPGTSPGDVFFYRLMSGLGALMIVLNFIIAAAAALRWVQVLRGPAAEVRGARAHSGEPVAVAGIAGGPAK